MFLSQVEGFIQVNSIKQTLSRRVFSVHRFSIIILKFLGPCYVDSLYKLDISLRRTAVAGPDVVRLRESSPVPNCLIVNGTKEPKRQERKRCYHEILMVQQCFFNSRIEKKVWALKV